MIDRVCALAAFAVFLAFFGILAYSVPRLDIGAVIAAGTALVGYDLWRQLFGASRR
jgi:hypothetical protein